MFLIFLPVLHPQNQPLNSRSSSFWFFIFGFLFCWFWFNVFLLLSPDSIFFLHVPTKRPHLSCSSSSILHPHPSRSTLLFYGFFWFMELIWDYFEASGFYLVRDFYVEAFGFYFKAETHGFNESHLLPLDFRI